MTRKLEELFDLPPSGTESGSEETITTEETRATLVAIDAAIDKARMPLQR